MKNLANKYKPFILENKRVSRSDIVPLGVYQISTYKTVKKEWKLLKSSQTAYIFVTGIHEGSVNCLKLSLIEPDTFFKWFGGLVNKGAIYETDKLDVPLYEIGKRFDRSGMQLYEQHVKGHLELKRIENPYRTYKITGIQHVRELTFKRKILEVYYG